MKFKFTRSTAAVPATRFESQAGAGLASLALAISLSLATSAQAADKAKEGAPAIAPVAVTATPADAAKTADATQADAAAKAAADKPGWIIIEEDFWVPLQYSPLESLAAVFTHYRHAEEKAAAAEIRKSVSWLKLAAGHAQPHTQKRLLEAAAELTILSKELAAGSVLAANALDAPLARASHALAEWHYYRAQETWGKTEEQNAGKDLVLAAHYLRQAADSAHFEFGKDTNAVVTRIWENGKLTTNKKETTHNWVAKDIEGVEKALHELGKTLEK